VKTFDEYVQMAEVAHGHICAGQILGLRMAVHGLRLLGIDDPTGRDRKRLVTFVEIDRCATDAIGVVTGCRLGKRALKFRDFGKMAATFCDVESGRAVRLSARDSSKDRARELHPDVDKRTAQISAYRELADEELFDIRWVRVPLGPEEMPGFKSERTACAECGEGISFRREVIRDGRILCKSCAGEQYWVPA
jgi:formylmethanofuran dehydrogenase subunit E